MTSIDNAVIQDRSGNASAVVGLVLVALADALLFQRPLGINAFLFTMAVAVGILVSGARRLTAAAAVALAGASFAACAPLLEAPSVLGALSSFANENCRTRPARSSSSSESNPIWAIDFAELRNRLNLSPCDDFPKVPTIAIYDILEICCQLEFATARLSWIDPTRQARTPKTLFFFCPQGLREAVAQKE